MDHKQALAHFPLELIETTGAEAMTKWQALKSAGRGTPVVLAGEHFSNLLVPFSPKYPWLRSVEDILQAADSIQFPQGLIEHKRARAEELIRKLKVGSNEKLIAALREEEPGEPPLGSWPSQPARSPGLTVAMEGMEGKPAAQVYVALAPTDDWTAVPAYLRWGNWNDCPAAEYHVAAMRTWRDRYGAELIGLSFDTLNIRVASRPRSREEALALARDQYVYCNDIIDQGVGSLSALAASLMASDWWYFWWD